MRLSASRIRSINRRLAQAQGLTWPARKTGERTSSIASMHSPAPFTRIVAVKVIAVPRSAAA
jgi:hypothetical protein